jgi:flavin reductase (DIM6/NTAB) family NADH-FMN oxidoreductase RutF
VPVLDEALAIMECTVVHQFKAGTHWVVIGEIQQNQCNSGEPLLYYNSAYQQIASSTCPQLKRIFKFLIINSHHLPQYYF